MKTTILLLISFSAIFFSCSNTKKIGVNNVKTESGHAFVLTEISSDNTYGYSEKNPIKVGGVKNSEGPLNERRFLNALSGPNGEDITYDRTGSCCPFKTENGFMGSGMLDRYEIKWTGQSKSVFLYINMYDEEKLMAPVGFTLKK